MKTTVTEEFNEQGKLTKRVTVTEQEEKQTEPYITYPLYPTTPRPWTPGPYIVTCAPVPPNNVCGATGGDLPGRLK